MIAQREGTFQPRLKVKTPKPKPKRKVTAVLTVVADTAQPSKKKKKDESFNDNTIGNNTGLNAIAATVAKPKVAEPAPPHFILLLTGLPEGISEAVLGQLFGTYPGFREVKLVMGRHDIAFVEYTNEFCASEAKRMLNATPLTDTHALQIAFARK